MSSLIFGYFLKVSTTPASSCAHRIAGWTAKEHDTAFTVQRLGDPFGPSRAGIVLVPIEISDIIFVVARRIGGPRHDLHAGVGRRA